MENQTIKKETVAEKAFRLLSPIPENEWALNVFTDQFGCCCAIGHYERLISDDPDDYSIENCSDAFSDSDLRRASKHFIRSKGGKYEEYVDISGVNNCSFLEIYPQKHPKDRVLAFIGDMIKAGY